MRDLELPGRSPVHAPHGMAATSSPLASQVAVDVMKAGGNAMDAAIAAIAVQCVVEPASTGIGGDCFCLYAPDGGDRIVGFNGSGRAPAAANLSYFQDRGIKEFSRMSPHAVTLPGAVDGWLRLNADHGRMSMAEVLAPAIAYARDGYPISSRVASDFAFLQPLLEANDAAARVFLPGGVPPRAGQRHHQPELATTLQAIADDGHAAFYEGEIAQDMVDTLRALGGLHTLDDFATVAGEYVTPISTDFRGYTVHECPPNGQGAIALLLLNMVQKCDLERDTLSPDRLHTELEACRLAYRARNLYIADPAFADIPLDTVLSDDYAARLVAAIDPARAQEPPADIPLTPHHDTVYVSVVDRDRNACSFINTLYMGFGSGLMAPKSGVMLQNRGHGFSLTAGHPNVIAGGKRPLNTIIPGMLTRAGRAVMPFGVMGGHYQAMGHMHLLTRLLDDGLDIQQAIDAPRLMVDPDDGAVECESTVPRNV